MFGFFFLKQNDFAQIFLFTYIAHIIFSKPLRAMPKMNVSRTATIHADAATVYSKLNDFNHWPKWSPWLIMEPDANVNIATDAKYYEWNGKRTGEGNMSITREVENQQIDYDLTFLKP